MHYVRSGAGKPLLLIHGLGGRWQAWRPILDDLTGRREVNRCWSCMKTAVPAPRFSKVTVVSQTV